MKFAVDFEGYVMIEAKNSDEAREIFENWFETFQKSNSVENPVFVCTDIDQV
jgi:hypothetical protein